MTRVLLVEDNPVDADLVAALADRPTGSFMNLAAVGSLAAALHMLRDGGFDVLLLDLFLPDARNLEAVTRVREEAPDLPIVVLTTRDDEELGLEAVRAGAQDFLIKAQISPEILFRSIKYATERFRREAAEGALLHRQKLDAVGQLAGGVAHEFNNMLHAISGTAALVLMDLAEDDPIREDLETIEQSANRAAGLTQQLLAFGRKQILQPRSFDLNELIERMEPLLRQTLEEHILIEVELASEPAPIRADPGSLEQVLLNLATNARDAMPDGGVLTITTAVFREEAEREGNGQRPSTGHVQLIVRDSGHGMSAVTQERAFEPFFTTKSQAEGAGLGLSTVYGIVRQSGGEVEVESAPGAGTTIAITLPAGAEADARPESEVAVPVSDKRTVLVVEDEDAVRRLTVRVLERGGFTVLAAADPPEALKVWETHQGTIDVLVTDVVMPRGSGPELAAQLKRRAPSLPVVFVSGYGREHLDRVDAAWSDSPVLAKPVSPGQLIGAVRAAVAG